MATATLKERKTQSDSQPTKVRTKKARTLEIALRGPTGPRTRRGKQKSRYNAIKYGIFSETVLKECESKAQFQSLRAALQRDLGLEGAMEELLGEKLAMLVWRHRRLLRAECAEIAKATVINERYMSEHYIPRLSNGELQRISQMGEEGSAAERYTVNASLVLHQDVLDRLLRYEASLDRSFDRTLTQLERLQRMRLGHAVPPPVKVELSR